MSTRRMASIKSASELLEHAKTLGLDLPIDSELETGSDAPLARPVVLDSGSIGNRFAILPMEGWDATNDGKPDRPHPATAGGTLVAAARS